MEFILNEGFESKALGSNATKYSEMPCCITWQKIKLRVGVLLVIGEKTFRL